MGQTEKRDGQLEDGLDHELNVLVEYFEDYEIHTDEFRQDTERDRDYYDNKQWTDDEITILNDRKQPVVTFNLVKRTVDAILGMERQNRTDPKAYPRTPQHQEDAESITDALRYVADNNDFDQVSSNAFMNLLIEGTEAVDVIAKEAGDKIEVSLVHVEWDRYFYDVHARAKDFSDAKYHGITIWMDLEDALEKWPNKKDELEGAFLSDGSFDDTFDDAPRTLWVAKEQNRKRLRINQVFYKKEGEWWVAFYTKSGFVVDPSPSQYVDENGDPEDSIVAASAFVDRDNVRYGYVRQLISPQDEVNKRRSKALHHISQRQTFGNKKAGLDAQTIKGEMAKPDGHVEMQSGEFGRDFGVIPTQDMAAGNFQLLQEAKDMFNTVGTNTSVAGTEDRVRSGRAEQFRQIAGTRELAPIMDIHQSFKRRIYRKIWNRIKQYWTDERWVRVTDDDKNLKWVGLNRQTTVGEQLQEEMGDLPPEFQNDPRMQVPIVQNQLSELDVDIMIEESPDYANIQQEQLELVTQLYTANPQAIPFEAIIELTSLRNKKAFIEQIRGGDEQQQQAAQEQAQQEQGLQTAERVAKLMKDQSSAERDEAQAAKTDAETLKIIQGGE